MNRAAMNGAAMNGAAGPEKRPSPAEPSPAAGPQRVRAALAAASAIGPFFALDSGPGARHPAAPFPVGSGWRPATDLYRSGLDGLLAQAGGQLATAEPRVAASILQLGYAARLWSPVLGCGLLGYVVPDLAGLQIGPAGGPPPVRLALAEPRGWLAADPARVAELSYRVVIEDHLEPLARALSGRVSAGLLWGNAASALAGALGVLVTARPGLLGPAAAVAAALLGTGRLANTGRLDVTGGGLEFRRQSCCLYYRLPGGGLCADCGLARPPGRPG